MMARPLVDLQKPPPDPAATAYDLRLAHRTSRSFAAAVSVLLLATVVVNRSGSALTGPAADSTSLIGSGTIEIGDDDEGRSLFDLRDLVPARPVTRCLELAYTGSILPVSLSVRADADGALAEYLEVTIEKGRGGGFESCDGFVPDAVVYDGTLDVLVDRSWIDVGDIVNSDELLTFRVDVAVQDRRDALGKQTTVELAWEATPS